MVNSIFEVEGNTLSFNIALLAIPEFKELMAKTSEQNAFLSLWAFYAPDSPYFQYEELERPAKIKEDYPGSFYNLFEYNVAREKAELMYTSTPKKLLIGAKAAVEKLAEYLATTEIEHGRDGNVSAVVQALKTIPLIINAYSVAEQAYKQELERARGHVRQGVDEDIEDDYNM